MKIYRTSAPKSVIQGDLHDTASSAGQPVVQQERQSWGVITAVSEKNQVRVRLYDQFDNNGNEKEVLQGRFIPVVPQLSQIQQLYGALRPGLQVLVHWRGKLEPNWAWAEVKGDEELDILQEAPLDNKVTSPPTLFLSGGLTDL